MHTDYESEADIAPRYRVPGGLARALNAAVVDDERFDGTVTNMLNAVAALRTDSASEATVEYARTIARERRDVKLVSRTREFSLIRLGRAAYVADREGLGQVGEIATELFANDELTVTEEKTIAFRMGAYYLGRELAAGGGGLKRIARGEHLIARSSKAMAKMVEPPQPDFRCDGAPLGRSL